MNPKIIKSLLKPSAYLDPTTSVRLVQTHVSMIFVTDRFVYKIKKPVDYGFLNFTTLDRRRFYCNEEVRLNRRLCPDIYLGVVELRRSPSGAAFFGEGKIIDYAVKMKRLPEERMLDRLVREDKVSDDDIRRIASTIASFHASADRSKEIDRYGSIENIRRNWDENFEQLANLPPATGSVDILRFIQEWGGDFMTDDEELFSRRVSQGFIRDCDGDIHMENICLTDRVFIFDCIEFNNRFRFSDTAADMAFLLMDFDYHEHTHFSDIFLDEYTSITGDREAGQVLPFYKVYRAIVRGKVATFRLNDPDADKKDAEQLAIRYFRLARGYIIRQKLSTSLIITCGLMGSGKSSIASTLACELGLDRLSSDETRKKISSVPKYSHAISAYGAGIYSAEADEVTYSALAAKAEQALANGHSVIIDASFRRRRDRDRFRVLAKKHAALFYIIETTAHENLLQQRLMERLQKPREVSDGRWELLLRQKEEFDPIEEDDHHFSLDTSRPLYDTADTILTWFGIL